MSISLSITPGDDFRGGSWALKRHTVRERPWGQFDTPIATQSVSWTLDGAGVDMYIIGTGIQASHSELQSSVAETIYRDDGAASDTDLDGYGTAVASAAYGLSGGYAQQASVFSVKIADTPAGFTDTLVEEGIDEVITHRAGRSGLDTPAVVYVPVNAASGTLLTKIESLITGGVVVVCPAGETYDRSTPNFLGFHKQIIVVGATNSLDGPQYCLHGSGFEKTGHGLSVSILAGGQGVRVASIEGNYGIASGSHVAAGHVLGMIAAWLKGKGALPGSDEVEEVRGYLRDTGTYGQYQPYPELEPNVKRLAYFDSSLSDSPFTTFAGRTAPTGDISVTTVKLKLMSLTASDGTGLSVTSTKNKLLLEQFVPASADVRVTKVSTKLLLEE